MILKVRTLQFDENFNNILSTAVEKWEICIKKEEKGKKYLKRVKKIRQIVVVGA